MFIRHIAKQTETNSYSLDLETTSSQYASVIDTSALINPTGNFTVEGWFRMETDITQTIVSNVVTDAGTYGPIYKVGVNASKLTAQTWDSGSSFLNLTGTTTLVVDTWYHFAFVKAAANDWTLYLGTVGADDVSEATSASSRTISGTGKTGIRLGANEGGAGVSTPTGGFFDGLVDEVRFWNTNLSLATINANKLTQISTSSSNLQAYYKLNNDYTDSTANAFNLTATASPVFSTTVPF